MRVNTALIEAGGIGLVMFHLARSGHEFVRTLDRSGHGDLWVQLGDRKVSVEVKTGSKPEWSVARAQVRSDFYCFIHLHTGSAYIVLGADMSRIMNAAKNRYPGVVQIKPKMLPRASHNAWGLLDCAALEAKKLVIVEPGAIIGMRRRNYVRPDGSVRTAISYRRAPRSALTGTSS